MRYYGCDCAMAGFCDRHVKNKDNREYKRCLSSDDYRRSMDIHTYGFVFDEQDPEYVGAIKESLNEIYQLKNENKEIESPGDIRVYVVGHDQEKMDSLPDLPYTRKFNLETAHYGKYEKYALAYPDLCENRFYFADLEHAEFTGTVTSSWREKFTQPDMQIENLMDWPSVPVMVNNPDRNVVLCAFYAFMRPYTEKNKYFEDFLEELNLNNPKNLSAWANQIICKRELFLELREFMIESMIKLIKLSEKKDLFEDQTERKYGMKRYQGRGLGLLAEELSARWFASRNDCLVINNQNINPAWYY